MPKEDPAEAGHEAAPNRFLMTPELAQAAISLLDRCTTQGLAEARTLLRVAAALEAMARE